MFLLGKTRLSIQNWVQERCVYWVRCSVSSPPSGKGKQILIFFLPGLIDETSVRSYNYALHNIPLRRKSLVLRDGSLKSQILISKVPSGSGVFIQSLVFSPRGRSGRSQNPVMEPIWLLAHCILGKFLGVVCHCFPPPLDVPTFAATCLCVHSDARDPSSERWNCGRERCPVVILPKFRLPLKFRDPLHAANPRHGTDGFTSPSKEGVLRIFFSP